MNSIVETMRLLARSAAYGAAILGLAASSDIARAADISVQRAWALATPPKATVGRAFMTILNTSSEDDHLVSATAEVAHRAEVSGIRMTASIPNIRQLVNLDIPAGRSIELAPGAYHILLRNLTKPLVPGETFKGTLTFAKAGVISVEYMIEAPQRSPSPPQ